MRMKNKELAMFVVAGRAALLTFQGMFLLLVIILAFAWEDSRWPAFDSDDYDKKMMNGPLKPWNRGN